MSERANERAQRSARAKQTERSKRVSERCERTSERTSEWPNFNIPISRFLIHCALILPDGEGFEEATIQIGPFDGRDIAVVDSDPEELIVLDIDQNIVGSVLLEADQVNASCA